MAENADLGVGSIKKHLIRLSAPAIAAQLVNALYNVVDRIYIGHMPGNGSLALTGVGICMPIIMLLSAFAGLLAHGGAPIAAIYMGKGENDNAEGILGNCFVMLIAAAVALTAIFQIIKEPFLMLVGASENTIGFAMDYLRIYLVGTVAVLISLGMNAFINTQGFAQTGMKTVLIGAVLNIILDFIFVPVLKMGVKGAALATIISQTVSAIWVLLFLCGKKTKLRIRLSNLRLKRKYVGAALSMGLSPFTMMSTESLISVILNSALARVGGDIAVGSMTIISSINQFVMLPLQGVGQGVQPIISYNYGAKNFERVKETFLIFIKTNVIFTSAVWLMIMLFAKPISGIFASSEDMALVEYTAPMMKIYFAMVIAMGVQTSCQQTFLATGQAAVSLFLAMLRKVILLMPLALLFSRLWQTTGVYFAEPVADFTAASVTFTIFMLRRKRIFGNKANNAAF